MHLGELGLKVLQHDNASADHKKIKRWDRRLHWLWSKLPDLNRKRTPGSGSRRAQEVRHEHVPKAGGK
jgi:hypothetical protein